MLVRETLKVWAWSFFNVPLLFAARPAVIESDEARVVVRIRLRRKTKNHLGSMYFGALCIGADVAGGLAAMRAIERSGGGISLIFKDVNGRFLRRAEGDVFFTCVEGEAIRELVALARSSGEREEMTVRVIATVAAESEPVADFTLTLSIKQKART
jgi:acyl-coenzyme A thioesterase PaaI-like protein